MVVALLIFGPKKLPEIGRSMGKAIRSFQEASKEFESEFKREAEQLEQAVKTTAELEPKQIAACCTRKIMPLHLLQHRKLSSLRLPG